MFTLSIFFPVQSSSVVLSWADYKSHDLKKLLRGNKKIKFSIIKRNLKQEKSKTLSMPIKENFRSRSNFVFAATISLLRANVMKNFKIGYNISDLSNNSSTCAVAIVVKVKVHCLLISFTAARNQWSLLVYLHIIERISIYCEKSYIGNKNIC